MAIDLARSRSCIHHAIERHISYISKKRRGECASNWRRPDALAHITRLDEGRGAHRRGCIRHGYHGRYLTFREPAQAGSDTSSITEFHISGRDLSHGESTWLSLTYSHVSKLKQPLTSGSDVSRRTPDPRNARPEQSWDFAWLHLDSILYVNGFHPNTRARDLAWAFERQV